MPVNGSDGERDDTERKGDNFEDGLQEVDD